MFLRNMKSYFYYLCFIVMTLFIFNGLFMKVDNNKNVRYNSYAKVSSLRSSFNFTNYGLNKLNVSEIILDEAREIIRQELGSYNWSFSGVAEMEDLITEKGGRPLKTIIISPWRSGATYLGSLLSSLPGLIYYFRPLNHLDVETFNRITRKNTTKPDLHLKHLKNALKCKLFNVPYEEVVSKYEVTKFLRQYYFDSRMWFYCKENEELCTDKYFRRRFCELFPFHVVKDVNVRLEDVEEILADEELNVKVVVLIRHPRAVAKSRQQLNGGRCLLSDCSQPKPVCKDLARDFEAAERLRDKYSSRIKVLRFEDLISNPLNTTRDLLQFLTLDLMAAAELFLEAQPKLNKLTNSWLAEEALETYDMRAPKHRLGPDICAEAMELWGYTPNPIDITTIGSS